MALAGLLLTGQALAAVPSERRGKAPARAKCARCHAVDRVSSSGRAGAPPFRERRHRFPIEMLAEALAEGLYTGHAEMPSFQLNSNQIDDFLVSLKTLE